MAPGPALRIEGLVKRFGGVAAVDGLDLVVERGTFHALLGPNGAGKTTTLRIVAGLARADAGRVAVLGHDTERDAMAARRVLAFLPDEPLVYGKLTAVEHLAFVAGLWRVDAATAATRTDALVERLDLGAFAHRRTEDLSRGQRQKVALAGALVHDPALLVLDEPLSGLDAGAARDVKDLLLERVRDGGTVVLTTHVLDTAERLAGRISIVDRGRVVADGTLEALRARGGAGADASLEDVFLRLTRGTATSVP